MPWIVSLFAYHILYSFFPLFILVFAYPTKTITVVIFMNAFMISYTALYTIFGCYNAKSMYCGNWNTCILYDSSCLLFCIFSTTDLHSCDR